MHNLQKLSNRSILFPIFSGISLALSFPPFPLFLLAWVALVPVLVILSECNSRQAFGRGYLFLFAFGLINFFWLAQFVSRWTNSILLGVMPYLLVCAAFAVYGGVWAMASAKAMERKAFWAIPLIWAGVEVFRSNVPYLAFPWALLGTSVTPITAFLQPAWWGGIYFLSAVLCLFNVFVLRLGMGAEMRETKIYVMTLLVIFAGSVVSYLYEIPGEKRVFVAAQPAVDLAFSDSQTQRRLLKECVPMVLKIGSASRRDLVVLPEGISYAVENEAPRAAFPLNFTVPTIMGGQRKTSEGTYQSLFAFDGKWQYADKTRLVIFGEYVPFREQLPFLVPLFRLPTGDLIAASEVKTLKVGKTYVGGMICFEALFEEVARMHLENGAQVLVIPSMDDWYQGTGAIGHLRAVAILRAAENRVPVVRSASTGPCLVVDDRGNVVSETEVGSPSIARGEVATHPPLVSPFRKWFPYLALAFWIFFLLIPRKLVLPIGRV